MRAGARDTGMRTMIRRRGWGVLAVILVACGGGSGDLPPVRPSSVVSGNAVDAEIQNGQVTIYAFGRSGEEASGGVVDVGEGQVLRAVAHYVSGQPLSLMVTPLTQLAAGLAEYQITRGIEAGAAVDASLASMNSLFGLAVSDVLPRNISAADGTTDQLSARYSYGFFLAALSSFTQWASRQNNVPTHTVYTSVSLAQVMNNDIRSAGQLDGRGLNKAGDGATNLALGNVALNQDVYRIALAQHLLAISAGPQNKTGLTRSDLRDEARSLATSAHAVFGGKVPAATSAFGPVIVPKLAPGSAFNGVYIFEVVIV